MKNNNLAHKITDKVSNTISDLNVKSVRLLKLVTPDEIIKATNKVKDTNWSLRQIFFQWLPAKLSKLTKSSNFWLVIVFGVTFVSAGVLEFLLEHSADRKDQYSSIWDGIWWAIVTVTTTGYGDHFPITGPGRIVAGLLMCFGIISSGIVTGNIASWLVERRMKMNQGLANLMGKTDHMVICGWKNDMTIVLQEIFMLNPTLNEDDVVIVAPISQETLEKFRAEDMFTKVHILRGDYYNKNILEHAAVKHAKKALVLSDESSARSQTEADAKTVMAVMSIKKMSPKVYVAAEIKDRKFDSYLKLGQCDEVIHSEQYSKILIANSVRSSGLSHILYDLLSVHTQHRILTEPIPAELIGKTFHDLHLHLKEQFSLVPIGLLENTGNIQDIKREALTAAQKNPNTRSVLSSLKEVKTMEVNLPKLNPPKDYIIKPHTMMVLVGTKTFIEEKGA